MPRRPALGIRANSVSLLTAKGSRVALAVTSCEDDSPFEAGDVILGVNGFSIEGLGDLAVFLFGMVAGIVVTFVVLRTLSAGGEAEIINLEVTLS